MPLLWSDYIACRSNIRARFYPNLLTTARIDHVVDHLPTGNGRYHVRRNAGRRPSVGRPRGRPVLHRQLACTGYFTGLPLATPPALSKAEMMAGEVRKGMAALPVPAYYPEFWRKCQRPSALVETGCCFIS